MAFRLERERSLRAGLERVLRKGIRDAGRELSGPAPSAENVHEARKHVKKIRAVLRLFREAGADYEKPQASLRDAAHRLSAVRDADALCETLATIHARYPRVATRAIARTVERGLRGRWHGRKRKIAATAAVAGRSVRRSRRPTLDLVREAAEPSSVGDGFEDAYRRARQSLKGLSIDSDATRFHRLRRRVKDHLYHVRLLEDLHPTARTRARRLERLETRLGEDHDCAALRAALVTTGPRLGDAHAAAVVLGCITKDQARLRRQALALGRRLLSPKPRALHRQMMGWWKGRSRGRK